MKKNPKSALIDGVKTTLFNDCLHETESGIIVAISGGSDSVGLLHILSKIVSPQVLHAVYINHGLRPLEIETEENHFKRLCKSWNISFEIIDVDVEQRVRTESLSVEDACRQLRYEALEQIRVKRDAKCIAVGHTSDDQVEEFFVRLIRGTGLKGLSGMNPYRDRIIRPLLQFTKNDIQRYLEDNSISWCTDSTNLERRFLRNRVRLDLLPLLKKEFNPSLDSKILKTMDVIREDESFLGQEAEKHFSTCVSLTAPSAVTTTSDLNIDLRLLCPLHTALQRRVLEKCFWKMAVRPSYELIENIRTLFRNPYPELPLSYKEVHLPGGVLVIVEDYSLQFTQTGVDHRKRGAEMSPVSHRMELPATGTYDLPHLGKKLILQSCEVQDLSTKTTNTLKTLALDLDLLSFPLILRTTAPGETFRPCNGRKKKISRFFNASSISIL